MLTRYVVAGVGGIALLGVVGCGASGQTGASSGEDSGVDPADVADNPDGTSTIEQPGANSDPDLEPLGPVLSRTERLLADVSCEVRDPELSRIARGGRMLCGVQNDATVRCGSDDGDELAGGASGSFGTVAGIGVTNNWVSVLNTDGELWFWSLVAPTVSAKAQGRYLLVDQNYSLDQFGRLARWTYVHGEPKAVPGPEGTFRQLSVFGGGVCAIDLEGEIHCATDDGSELKAHHASLPAGPFEQVSASACGNCAIRENGQVQCWGGAPTAADWGEFNGVEVSAVDTERCVICIKPVAGEAACWQEDIGAYPALDCASALSAR